MKQRCSKYLRLSSIYVIYFSSLTKVPFLASIRKAKSIAPAWTFPNRGAKHLKHPFVSPAGSRAVPSTESGDVCGIVLHCNKRRAKHGMSYILIKERFKALVFFFQRVHPLFQKFVLCMQWIKTTINMVFLLQYNKYFFQGLDRCYNVTYVCIVNI